MLVVVAALSIQDPRERPVDKEAQADQSHARFKDERSDFATLHKLWLYLKEQQKELSHSAFRRMCKAEYLHYLRIREWQDLHAQLRAACRSVRIDPDVATSARDAEPDWDTIHKALLAGLLSHVGARDQAKREYAGARGARFGISPGSALFRKQPDLVMAAELVETSRLWARVNAAIEPEWAEEVGAHVVARTVSEPRWSRKAGAAVATERVTLYGVPLVTDRTIQYARIDAEAAREIFIRSAFVEGDWEPQHDFWKRNSATLARVSELEERARRRDIVVDDEVLFAFYDARIPPDVPTERHFDRWWRGERRRRPDLLTLTEDDLTSEAGEQVSAADYPRTWRQGDLDLDVTYQFSPGEAADGVTVHVPVAVLNRVTSDGFDWQVPGLRDDLAIALLKSLPKATRRHFVPTPDHAMAALAQADPARGPLIEELARVLHERTGIRIPPGEWDLSRVPDHLRVTFSVDGPGGRVVARGKDLDAPAGPRGRRGAGRDGARRGLAGAHRPDDLVGRHRARDVRGALRRAHRRGLPRPRRRGRLASRCACSPTAVRRGPHTDAGCGGCSCSTPPHRGNGCWPGSPTPRSWASPTTRTGRSPRCCRTASTPPSTTSSPSTCPARCAPKRRTPPRSPPCAPTPQPGCSSSSRRSSRCSPWPRRCAAPSRRSSGAPPRHARPPPAPTCGPSSTASCGPASSRRPGWPGCATCGATCSRCSTARSAPPRTRASPCSRSRWMPWRPPTPTSSRRCLRPGAPRPTSPTSAGWSRSCGSACSPRRSAPPGPVSEKRVRAAIAAVTASR